MSLLTDHRQIIIGGDNLFDSSDDVFIDREEEERFLCALRKSEFGVTSPRTRARSAGGTRASASVSHPRQRNASQPPRRADPAALARLNAPTSASNARAQRKYVDRMNLAKETPPRRPHVSKIATRAGERLYACATSQRHRLERMREDRAAHLLAREEQPTFRPVITPFAERLADAGYRPPHERYGDALAKQQRAELQRVDERHVREAAGCTFHPVVSPSSARLARGHWRHSEPFVDAGDRLFVDGGRRLIRQQLRQRIIEQRAARRVVGGYEMSAGEAGAVAARLRQWGEERNRRVDCARENNIRSATQRAVSARSTTPRGGTGKESRLSNRREQGERHKRHNSLQKENTPSRRMSHSRPARAEVIDDLRALRYRALFVKYASSNRAPTLRLRDVKRQVRELFPADSGVVAALASDFSDDAAIDRNAFVASLSRFVARHGPQPWAEPSAISPAGSQEKGASPASVVLSSATDDTAAPEDVVAELEALLASPEERSSTASPKRRASSSPPRHHRMEKAMREARKLIAVRGI